MRGTTAPDNFCNAAANQVGAITPLRFKTIAKAAAQKGGAFKKDSTDLDSSEVCSP